MLKIRTLGANQLWDDYWIQDCYGEVLWIITISEDYPDLLNNLFAQ